MTTTAIVSVVKEELKNAERKGYIVKEVTSKTTNSSYWTVSDGKNEIAFRISDHPTYRSNICTLDSSYGNVTPAIIKSFIKNRIDGLRYRALQSALAF